MARKVHVTKEGAVRACNATVRPCRYGPQVHFESSQEAREWLEAVARDTYGGEGLPTLSQKQKEEQEPAAPGGLAPGSSEPVKQEARYQRPSIFDEERWQEMLSHLRKPIPVPTEAEAKKLVQGNHEAYLKLVEEDRDLEDALQQYTGPAGEAINRYLRAESPYDEAEAIMNENEDEGFLPGYVYDQDDFEEYALSTAEALDRGEVNLSWNDEPRSLYRYRAVPKRALEAFLKTHELGKRVTDRGFTSTSEDPSYVAAAVQRQRQDTGQELVVYRVLTSRGVPCDQQGYSAPHWQYLEQHFECERLLPRDCGFYVAGVNEETLAVDESRKGLKRFFESPRGFFAGEEATPLVPQRVTVITLVDEELSDDRVI